jgi:glycosyltransferase involved in cell wall biosynthesis
MVTGPARRRPLAPLPAIALYAHAIVSVRWMRPADTLGAGRDTTCVCLVSDAATSAENQAALAELAKVTPADAPLMVLGVEPDDGALLSTCEALRREVAVLERSDGDSVSELLGRAARAAGQADLALVSAGCRLPTGWLVRLRAAAWSDRVVATATPMSSGGGTAALPDGGRPEPDRLVAASAAGTRPRLMIGGPDCLYARRSAIELVGAMPGRYDALGPAIAAFCLRCLEAGLVNVVADDLYVTGRPRLQAADQPLVSQLMNLDRSDERSPLARSLALTSSVLSGLSVTVDARSLGAPAPGGTQRYTRELILALARHTDTAVRVVVGPDIAPADLTELAGVKGLELITYEQAVSGVRTTHVVHRPQQVFSAGDLNLLVLLGRRVVVTHQDLIAYHNPTYHETFESWEQYRRITRIALAAADRVILFSEHSRRDAQAEDLVGPDRSDVVGAALTEEAAAEPRQPPRVPAGENFILCLGPDYHHKNRPFAIAVVGALRAQHGWTGRLVLAGAHVPHGSSRAQEVQLLAADAELRRAVLDLGAVNGPERDWLLRNASAVIVPSVVEGFGLVPLEAAQVGVPCLFAPQSSLVEVMDSSLATLVGWDAAESARRVMPLLRDGAPRRRQIEVQRAAAARWSWETIAGQLVQAYERALRAPHRAAAVRAWQELERERYLVEVEQDRRRVLERLSGLGDSIALAGPDGFLTAREQQGLLRVGARPPLRRLTLWPFTLLGSIGNRSRTGESSDP